VRRANDSRVDEAVDDTEVTSGTLMVSE
jgi:hypothetical protein